MPVTAYGTVRDKQYKAALKQEDYWQNLLPTLLGSAPPVTTFMPTAGGVYESASPDFPPWGREARYAARQKFALQVALQATEDSGPDPQLYQVGQDRIYGGPGQVPNYDASLEPLPRAYPRAIDLKNFTWQEPNLTLLGQDRIYGAPGQVPTEDFQMPPRQEPVRTQRYLSTRTQTDVAQSDTFYIGFDRMYGAPGQVPSQDFPNPPRGYARALDLKLFFDSLLPITLTGQDQIYAGPGQVPAYDWQNALPPRGYARAVDLRLFTFQESNGILLAQDVIYSAPGQVANYLWQNALPNVATKRPQPEQYPVLPTLYVVNDVPFAPVDVQIAVPRGYRRPPQDWSHESDIQLIGQDAFPQDNVDLNLQMPNRGYRRPSPDWIHASDVQLIGQDSLFGVPGQVQALDLWLPPRGYSRAADLRTWLSTFPLSDYRPFAALDLPNPSRGYRRPPLDWQHASDMKLVGQDAFPQTNYDSALELPSRGYRRPPQDFVRESDVQLIGQDALFGAPGQVQALDLWTPPRGYPRALDTRLFSLSDVFYIGQDRFYGAPGQVPTEDFPLPNRGYRRPSPDWVRSSDVGLYAGFVAPPFLGAVFELAPRGYTRPSKDWVRASDVHLIGQDVLPRNNYDTIFQLPRGYKRASPDWVRASDVVLIGEDAFPQANADGRFLVPRGYRRPSPDWLRASDIILIGQDALPRNNYDTTLQLPRGYRRPSPDWLHSSDVQLIGADAFPQYNLDGNLVLPSRGYRRPSPDWVRASDVILIGADQFPQSNYQHVVDLPPFYAIKRRIAEPSTLLGSPTTLTTQAPPTPLTINDVAYVLPNRGYSRLSTSDLSIARGLFPVYIVVRGANKQLEAYLFVPDVGLSANLWVPDGVYDVESVTPDVLLNGAILLPDASFSVESEAGTGPDIILPGTSD